MTAFIVILPIADYLCEVSKASSEVTEVTHISVTQSLSLCTTLSSFSFSPFLFLLLPLASLTSCPFSPFSQKIYTITFHNIPMLDCKADHRSLIKHSRYLRGGLPGEFSSVSEKQKFALGFKILFDSTRSRSTDSFKY